MLCHPGRMSPKMLVTCSKCHRKIMSPDITVTENLSPFVVSPGHCHQIDQNRHKAKVGFYTKVKVASRGVDMIYSTLGRLQQSWGIGVSWPGVMKKPVVVALIGVHKIYSTAYEVAPVLKDRRVVTCDLRWWERRRENSRKKDCEEGMVTWCPVLVMLYLWNEQDHVTYSVPTL